MTFSVVVTTFNRPQLLEQALKGIEGQLHPPHQIIVVDDASVKDNRAIIRQFSNLTITYHKLPLHSGANMARNAGILLANQEVVAFIDDDDIWFDNYLQTLNEHYTKGAQAIVTGYQRLEKRTLHLNSDPFVTKASLQKGNTYCGTSGFSCRREHLAKIQFDEDLYNGQDWDMYVQLVQHGIPITNISKPLFYYREGSFLSISKMQIAMTPEDVDIRFRSANKHRKFIGEANYRRRIGEQILMHLLQKRDKRAWVKKAISEVGVWVTLTLLVEFAARVLSRKFSNHR
jgi:GalNAc5-diNAcBac-PP-undecaprenol beta-1,3-glucosyltransferase